ncbi:hypothetical protein ACFS5M_12055 [Lacinutrix iliipiscaria]|uniref:Uncharacterized protein n=1 Tax=Lacinutrix iliipiscaria TaxID=1230532 RepID=A0ABW5WR17_9FLAO
MKDKQIPAYAGNYEFKMPKLGESITEAANFLRRQESHYKM